MKNQFWTITGMKQEGVYCVGTVVTARTASGYEGPMRGVIVEMTGIKTSPWKVRWSNGSTCKTNLSAVVKPEFTKGCDPQG